MAWSFELAGNPYAGFIMASSVRYIGLSLGIGVGSLLRGLGFFFLFDWLFRSGCWIFFYLCILYIMMGVFFPLRSAVNGVTKLYDTWYEAGGWDGDAKMRNGVLL